jgi:prophage DNA circulation protein
MSTPEDFAAAAQSLGVALLAAISDPADAVRMLSGLAQFDSTDPTATAVIEAGAVAMLGPVNDLFRRTAIIALARASASYQPSSYDDAANVRTLVCGLIDGAIQTAGNQGDDASYSALRALRVAVAQDLTARGANLAHITTVETSAQLPALVIAQRLYQDATRADELVTQANPIHPAFMPGKFKALSE